VTQILKLKESYSINMKNLNVHFLLHDYF
jgi:hypothetical protein